MEKTPIEPGIIQRAIDGAKYIVTGVKPTTFFGPQQPLQPMAQNPDNGAVGRQFDYRTGVNINIQPKVVETAISYAQLRGLADNLDILRLVIETRKDQIEAFDWEIVAKDGRTVSDEKRDAVKQRMLQPTPEYDWASWLRMILEDLFVLDAVCIYPRMTRGGELYSLDLIDGGTIKRVIDDGGRTPLPPDPAYQQVLKGIPAVDYTSDELIYRMRNPRTNRIYGFSQVEQILMTVNIAIRRQLTQLQYFTEGNIPEALMSVPDTWNPDQVAQFQMYWDSLMQGNLATRSRMKFVPMDTSKIHETKEEILKDVFDEWLARIVCYAFSVPPAPFVREMNRATANTAKETATQEGLQPLMMWVKRLVDGILVKYMKESDVEFKWKVNEAVDPVDQARVDQIYVTTGIRTANEVRSDRGWDEFKNPSIPSPAPGETIWGATDDQNSEAIEVKPRQQGRPEPDLAQNTNAKPPVTQGKQQPVPMPQQRTADQAANAKEQTGMPEA